MPGLVAAHAQAVAQVGAAGADGDDVGGAAVLDLVDHELALVDQVLAGKADRQVELDTLARQGELAVVVGQHQVELVGGVAARFLEAEADEARVDGWRDVLAIEAQAVGGGYHAAAGTPVSTRLSSTRRRVMLNSMRRGWPLRSNRVPVSDLSVMTHWP